ncbi:hypothetical protein EV44_g2434 [Erysiphe necator]|uniref:Chromo domain-containing protein n=1 Tax=Uncinula necator TaxID=52586 RepID=A0A0B1P9N0_UNCNE|nr:hypothetical protein EV44_g2434 [Erysiphe necator]
MLALNNRTSASLGMSPFFAEHGYNIDPIEQVEPLSKPSEPAKRAQAFVNRIREAQELAQAAMASAQARMEESANKKRREAELFKVGDRVWLNLKHVQTPQLSKKLSWINAKYQITKVIDSHTVQLNTPSGIWPRFHVDLIKIAATDPFPSQIIDDEQPQPITPQISNTINVSADTGEEQYVEKILRAENKKIGRGYRQSLLVKWKGFAEPTWEPRQNLEDTEALDVFESLYGTKDNVGECEGTIIGRRKVTKRSLLKNAPKKNKNKNKTNTGISNFKRNSFWEGR